MSRGRRRTTLTRWCLALGGLGACATLAAGAHAASPTVHAAVAPCAPRVTTFNGLPASLECGPATATLTVGARTYDFHGGQCRRANGILTAQIGEHVAQDIRRNEGKPYLAIVLSARTRGSVIAYSGGELLAGYPESFTTTEGLTGHGTFVSITQGNEPRYTGSWNCHGAIVTTH